MPTDPQQRYIALEGALRSGDLETARTCFEPEAGFPNVRDPLTWTPLLELAISWSPLATIEQLLALGASVNYEAADGYPAVYAAIDSDRPDRIPLAQLVLSHGADVNQRGVKGYTPLHLAVAQKDAAAMELLLAHGADTTLKTQVDDLGPIEEAELLGNPEGAAMLRRLLDR